MREASMPQASDPATYTMLISVWQRWMGLCWMIGKLPVKLEQLLDSMEARGVTLRPRLVGKSGL